MKRIVENRMATLEYHPNLKYDKTEKNLQVENRLGQQRPKSDNRNENKSLS